jgi:hypothetical protein
MNAKALFLIRKNQKSRLIANFLFYTGCLLQRDKSRAIAFPTRARLSLAKSPTL